MCDYSLEAYSSRRAIAGEDLTLRGFPTGSQGFTSADDEECVVCCEPGMTMTLHLEDPVDVTFATRQDAFHRDGVTMPDGTFKSLQWFQPGLKATVIKPLPEAIVEAAAGDVAFEPEILIEGIGALPREMVTVRSTCPVAVQVGTLGFTWGGSPNSL